MNDYSEYTVKISSEPSYYGSECTTDDAGRIVEQIAAMLEAQFPGITTVEHHDGEGSGKTTGPNESVVEEINLWIEKNWTAAL